MNKTVLFLLCAMALASSCHAQHQAVDLADIIGLFDCKSSIAVGDGEEQEASLLMAKAVETFTARGFTQGLTGDGYGGPCVIIDGFYKGGTVDTVKCAFVPGRDTDAACVVEMSACNDGDAAPYELYMSVELFALKSAMQFIDQCKRLGFKEVTTGENDDRVAFTDGRLCVDYVQADGVNGECHYFGIQTAERRAGIDNSSDPNPIDYQEH